MLNTSLTQICTFQQKYKNNTAHTSSKMESIMAPFIQPPHLTMSLLDFGSPYFTLDNLSVKRTDHVVSKIPVSLYAISPRLPTVIYIHSYNSNRLEIKSILEPILKSKCNVVSMEIQRVNPKHMKNHPSFLDHENGIITFGHFEFEQIRPVAMWVKKYINDKFVLWGRSMGAVCALNYQHKYRDAHCLVVDSPFKSLLQTFCLQINAKMKIPTFISMQVLKLFRQNIEYVIKFNVEDMQMSTKMSFSTPILFIAKKNDTITGNSSQFLYNLAKGKKSIIYTQAEHDEPREDIVVNESILFFKEILKIHKPNFLEKKLFAKSQHILKRSRIHNIDSSGKFSHIQYPKKKQDLNLQDSKSKLQTLESEQLSSGFNDECYQRMEMSCLF